MGKLAKKVASKSNQSWFKFVPVYVACLALLIVMASQLAQAADSYQVTPVEADEALTQEQLDNLLAPIALYPDSLLSHILIASTYPLELIQAARWRDAREELEGDEALELVETKNWDPSVKALVAFPDLLSRLSEDLDWLQQLGDAFLADEEFLLSRVQHLRYKAKEQGNLANNDYIEVVEEEEQILIQPVEERIVYVPYYDTRVIYGDWWWHSRPHYWVSPVHYVWHAGFYWSPRIYFGPRYYHYGGFHWRKRHLVVNHYYYNHGHRYNRRPVVRNTEYKRWQHQPSHRKGVRYQKAAIKNHSHIAKQEVKRRYDPQAVKQRIKQPIKVSERANVKNIKQRQRQQNSQPIKRAPVKERQLTTHYQQQSRVKAPVKRVPIKEVHSTNRSVSQPRAVVKSPSRPIQRQVKPREVKRATRQVQSRARNKER